MLAVYQKEINLFFSSMIGYIAIIFYLIITGFFVWIYPGDNILHNGYADLYKLFELGPLVMLLLVPAITMRSFAEEFDSGTIEFLLTKPLSDSDILLGKFFASYSIVVIAILPTTIYIYSVYQLGLPVGNIDLGACITSYLGLLMLAGIFVAIGLFSSLLTRNTISAFLVSLFLSYVIYRGFSDIAHFPMIYGHFDHIIENIGIHAHYQAIQKGVLESREIIYFTSMIIAFLGGTKLLLEKRFW